jgi:hypothetical protein
LEGKLFLIKILLNCHQQRYRNNAKVRLKALPVKDNIDNLANTKATTMRTCSSTGEFIGELITIATSAGCLKER